MATGANSSPPDCTMRLTFEVCHEAVSRCSRHTRDSVARTLTLTIRRAIATKIIRPIAGAMEFSPRAAHRINLTKLDTPDGTRHQIWRRVILRQLNTDRKDIWILTPIAGRLQKTARCWEANCHISVARKNEGSPLSTPDATFHLTRGYNPTEGALQQQPAQRFLRQEGTPQPTSL